MARLGGGGRRPGGLSDDASAPTAAVPASTIGRRGRSERRFLSLVSSTRGRLNPGGRGKPKMLLRSIIAALAGIALTLVSAAAQAETESRVALVIGNGAYGHVPRLDNPVNDARLIAATLKDLGFTLIGDGAQQPSRSGKFRAVDPRVRHRALRQRGRAVLLRRPRRAVRAPTISCPSAPIRRARPTSISRWWTPSRCCSRWSPRARSLTS